jgi:L-threonylcarbamoyladenylate synthase
MKEVIWEIELENAANAVLHNKVILYPTDTIWGIGGHALNEEVYEKINQIKRRPVEKSFILLVNGIEMLNEYVSDIHPRIETLLELYEKPLTLIYSKFKNLPVKVFPNGTVAIRLCKDPFCQELIKRIAMPLISTSANLAGMPSPKCFGEISEQIRTQVDYIVNYRTEERTKGTSSQIARFNDEGELSFLR